MRRSSVNNPLDDELQPTQPGFNGEAWGLGIWHRLWWAYRVYGGDGGVWRCWVGVRQMGFLRSFRSTAAFSVYMIFSRAV